MIPDGREERIDRILEFLANNQAQLSAQQAEVSARNVEVSARNAELSQELSRLEKIVASHSTQIEANSAQISELGRYLLNLAHIVQHTDERLNAVIAMVERRFGNGERPPNSE